MFTDGSVSGGLCAQRTARSFTVCESIGVFVRCPQVLQCKSPRGACLIRRQNPAKPTRQSGRVVFNKLNPNTANQTENKTLVFIAVVFLTRCLRDLFPSVLSSAAGPGPSLGLCGRTVLAGRTAKKTNARLAAKTSTSFCLGKKRIPSISGRRGSSSTYQFGVGSVSVHRDDKLEFL